jgi:hypothetical protein
MNKEGAKEESAKSDKILFSIFTLIFLLNFQKGKQLSVSKSHRRVPVPVPAPSPLRSLVTPQAHREWLCCPQCLPPHLKAQAPVVKAKQNNKNQNSPTLYSPLLPFTVDPPCTLPLPPP